ncbi:conserved hypothetical protein [Aspergillus terreus NIH2624]|uniref:Sensor histidine kinase/response regulator n=1 Tax=Aspergillus terreus (strain NIH 2624 / FGSC A1156) TaxID=341663 RepID=Q0CG70_ASPTN|nr:uncharacterized protein ATEG_07322 [Aspergillus terreus NIH2624]EAU32706.1 conserved hypothetical protein [Aspergillus terreus NIH2624]
MVLLDPTVASRSHSLPIRQRLVPELLRLYSPEPRDNTNGVQANGLSSSLHRRKDSAVSWSAQDPTLLALTQLGVFRLSCDQAFTTILDGRETNIISHATPSTSHPSTSRTFHGGTFGMRTLGLKWDGYETVDSPNVTADATRHIIRDVSLETELQSHPFIVRHPHVRFYAEVPLHTTNGEVFGTYCVVGQQPRPAFEISSLRELRDVADSISHHLENVWTIQHQQKSDRMLNALVKFVQSQSDAIHTEQRARSMSIASSSPFRRLSELHDNEPLSRTSSNATRSISPRTTRHGGSRASSSHPHEPSLREKHQAHVRRRSDESSTLVTVSEGAALSPGTSLLFSRASALIRESMELDGVMFLDASRTCEPMGMAVSESSAENKENISRLALTEGLLRDMFTAFPNGEIFHPGEVAVSFPIAPNGGRRHSLQSFESKQHLHHVVTHRLANEFPEAKSLVFLPLWNWDTSRWLAGALVWTSDPRRALGSDDLAYLKTFGDSLVAEFSQLGWTATEQSKSDLLSSVSHELRSPLHGMLASAELLQTTPLEPAQRDMVTMVETCGLTLLDTMNYLLDFAKINNLTHVHKSGGKHDRVELDNLITPFDLDSMLEDVTESLYAGHRSLMDASKIAGRYLPSGTGVSGRVDGLGKENHDDLSVVVRIEEQDSWVIRSISGAWRRIVMNILGNAFKFTRSGLIEVSLSKTVERHEDYKTTFASLSITDTGCGISSSFLEHQLFKPFAQEDILTEGVGLGLSIVYRLATYLGGSIEVKSQVGVGTTVDVRIPVEFAAETPLPLHTTSLKMPDQPGSRTMTRVCLVGLNAYADLRDAPCGVLSTEAKRKLSVRGAVSNVLLSQPGWMVCFADSLEASCGDIAIIEESGLKKISAAGSTKPDYRTIIVLGERGVSLPGNFTIEGADIIYLSQPIGPRKIKEALQRYIDSHREASPTAQSPIAGPFSGIPQRGRSLSDAFALAKGIESPPVMKENVAEFAPASPQAVDHKNFHVLIVDDNDINIKILATFMRRIGCSYETATNGQMALDKYKERNGEFDYILMDISMPIMDGIIASSKIREYEEQHSLRRAAIMAVTGVASSGMQQQAFAAGIDDYLVKPLSLHDLKRIMNIA